jgi:FdhD protein
MRTPGSDTELAVGFLMTEGVLRDEVDIAAVHANAGANIVTVALAADVEVSLGVMQRNFYTTSSCGICGKASLQAVRTVCPPRRANEFAIDSETLCTLPAKLRQAQGIFDRTGGLHAAGLFGASGELASMREDVGRHNAVDKLIGAALFAGTVPLRDRLLLLSGRASFELLQKAVMGGIPLVAAVGAPSSLAVEMASEFDVTLVGFLRENYFNVYHGSSRIRTRELARVSE